MPVVSNLWLASQIWAEETFVVASGCGALAAFGSRELWHKSLFPCHCGKKHWLEALSP